MTTRWLRNLAVFLTAATFSSAAYAQAASRTVSTEIAGHNVPHFIVAALACVLIRVVIWTESKNKLLVYNLAISTLAVLGSIVYTVEYVEGVAAAFGVGLTVGSGAVGLIEFAKSKMLNAIKEALLKSMSVGGDKS